MRRIRGIFWFCTICFVIISIVSLVYATTFSVTYDTASPLGTDAPSTIDDQIRNLKEANRERNDVDHYWALTGSQVSDAATGEHRKISFYGPLAVDPTYAANKGWLYMKDVSGTVEAFWEDELGNVLQLTDGGTINIVSADLVGTLANNTYFTAVNQAGTGTVELIKADASNTAVVPDGIETATSAAPTVDAGVANKKYVDDQVDTQNMTPASYTGQESVTFANGMIMKMGNTAYSTNPQTITFGSAFPTALVTVTVTGQAGVGVVPYVAINGTATSNFIVRYAAAQPTSYRWTAIGY